MNEISIIGAGAWGTALAQVYAINGFKTILWAREDSLAQFISTYHENNIYLKNIPLSKDIETTSDLEHAAQSNYIFLVVPAQFLGDILKKLTPHLKPEQTLVVCAKGIEKDSLKLLSTVVSRICPNNPVAVLTGPNFAHEIARGLPSASTLACANEEHLKKIQPILSTKNLRLYTTSDIIGAQIGGAIKNIIAIACGIIHGLNLGESARAALVTRGVAEMARLSVALGGQRETLLGQCGIGDIMLTCSSLQSRNFSYGVMMGQHNTPETTRSVVEGVHTAHAAYHLAQKMDIDMPIVSAVYHCLYQNISVENSIHSILTRPARDERE